MGAVISMGAVVKYGSSDQVWEQWSNVGAVVKHGSSDKHGSSGQAWEQWSSMGAVVKCGRSGRVLRVLDSHPEELGPFYLLCQGK